MDQTWVGVDVSKKHLDVFADGRFEQFGNEASGVSELRQWLGQFGPCHVIVEATGGYEQLVLRQLSDAGVAVSLVNPARVRQFARAMGKLAKTDRLDASILARYGEVRQPTVAVLAGPELEKIQRLSVRRRQLNQMIRQEKCALEQVDRSVRHTIEQHLEWLEEAMAQLQQQIDEAFSSHAPLATIRKVLMDQPGVGKVVSSALVAEMPELGRVNGKQAAALAGLAPFNRDSGQMRGRRTCWGGRPELRAALYMAALTAGRWNPKIKPLYDRLTAAGRPKKTVLIACARKLLVILNAIIRDHLRAQAVPS